MARSKPCEYCEDDYFGDYQEHKNGFVMWFEFYPFNGLLAVTAQANDEEGELLEDTITFNLSHCPFCGRKL